MHQRNAALRELPFPAQILRQTHVSCEWVENWCLIQKERLDFGAKFDQALANDDEPMNLEQRKVVPERIYFSTDQTFMNHLFLKTLAPAQAEALSLLATEARFGQGESIFRQREAADGFYLIETGEVSLEYELPGKGTVLIQRIGPGEMLGLSWLFEPYRWEFSAIAISNVTAKFLRTTDVRKLCDQDPKLGYKLMEGVARVLNGRLQATRHRLRVFVQRATEDDDERQVC